MLSDLLIQVEYDIAGQVQEQSDEAEAVDTGT